MAEPRWLTRARAYIGLREVPGARTEPVIAGWLKRAKAWWNDDETPWCGTFVDAVMRDCGIGSAKAWYRAQGWLEWGQPLSGPTLGAIVVFKRTGGGHVGIIAGIDDRGNLMVLGGNQGNAVCIMPFARDRVIGYRWPVAMPVPGLSTLPVLASTGALSRNEA
jgi:uncharacterized protein (TIGR02594 family)